jgi:hypothetical protein
VIARREKENWNAVRTRPYSGEHVNAAHARKHPVEDECVKRGAAQQFVPGGAARRNLSHVTVALQTIRNSRGCFGIIFNDEYRCHGADYLASAREYGFLRILQAPLASFPATPK